MSSEDKDANKPVLLTDESRAFIAMADAALDAVGNLLRIWGKHAFNLDQLDALTIRDLCERWARHILVGAPYPGIDPQAAEDAAARRNERNWNGLRDFALQLRRRENTYVISSLRDVRKVLGELVNSLGTVVVEDQEEQAEIAAQINHLKQVIESDAPLDTLKREAMQVISTISRVSKSRHSTRSDALGVLTEKLESLRNELNEARREMGLDALTALHNRKAFDQYLRRSFELSKLSTQHTCLLMMDLDHFKNVNDQFGHQAGDLVLKGFAECCTRTFPRQSDFIARYGGEEFAVILRETAADAAKMLGERLLQAVRSMRIKYNEHTLKITASIGLAELGLADDPETWLRRADSALYRAKNSGRDRLVQGFNI